MNSERGRKGEGRRNAQMIRRARKISDKQRKNEGAEGKDKERICKNKKVKTSEEVKK